MNSAPIKGLHSSLSRSRVVVFNKAVVEALALSVVRSQLDSNAYGKRMLLRKHLQRRRTIQFTDIHKH